jgi:hypothetical protein
MRLCTTPSILASCACCALLLGGAEASAQVWVIDPSLAGLTQPFERLPESSSSPVEIDLDELDASAEALSFELPDGTRLVASRHGSQTRPDGGLTWRGWIDDPSVVAVTLTRQSGVLSGRIDHRGSVFLLLPAVPGSSPDRIVELSGEPLGECAIERDVTPQVSVSAASDHPFEGLSEVEDSSSEITLLVLYSPQARAAAGGVSLIDAQVQGFVDASNTAFINSGMGLSFTLVHRQEVARDDSGDSSVDLSWLSSDPDVAALRNEVGADLVALIVETTEAGNCGRGRLPGSAGQGSQSAAFQVSRRFCSLNQMTFAHEHGHNLGMGHDDDAGIFDYSRGHLVDGAFRTLMARVTAPCGLPCPRVPYFSNPNVSLNGAATGTAGVTENALTGTEVGPFVANYRWNRAVDLTSIASTPTTTSPGETLSLSFGVTSESAVNLILGASLRAVDAEDYDIHDPGNDVLRAIGEGAASYARSFTVPSSLPPGGYDLAGALWYDVNRDNRITVADQRVAFLERLAHVVVQPAVTVTAIDSIAGEPSSDGVYRISRSSPGDSLTVNVAMTGSATSGSDYGAIGPSVTLASGEVASEVVLDIADDALIEGDETATLGLQPGSGYRVGSPASASIVIADDESAGGSCLPDWTLSCGSSDAYNNGAWGSTDAIDTYVCSGVARGSLTGPEYTYRFTPSERSLATATLSGMTADLDLFALATPAALCLGANCLGVSELAGTTPEMLTFSAAAGTTYYLVVDGFAGAVSGYTIAVTCEPLPDAIFSDGFESGGTSAWSGISPP